VKVDGFAGLIGSLNERKQSVPGAMIEEVKTSNPGTREGSDPPIDEVYL
jgi:hypothetical protein